MTRSDLAKLRREWEEFRDRRASINAQRQERPATDARDAAIRRARDKLREEFPRYAHLV